MPSFSVWLKEDAGDNSCILKENCDCNYLEPCKSNFTDNPTSLSFLFTQISNGFVGNMQAAVDIMTSYPGVTEVIDPTFLAHTSFNYFCCHSDEEVSIIVDTLHHTRWSSIDISFQGALSNINTITNTTSLVALADEESQAKMLNLTRTFENAIRKAGVPINHPRKFPFHSTLGQVNQTYPACEAVRQINETIGVFNDKGPIKISSFWMGLHHFKAHDGNDTMDELEEMELQRKISRLLAGKH